MSLTPSHKLAELDKYLFYIKKSKYPHLTPFFSTKQYQIRILHLSIQTQMVIVYRKPCYQDFNVQKYLNNPQTWFEKDKLTPLPPPHEFLALNIRIYNFFKTSMMLKYTFILVYICLK